MLVVQTWIGGAVRDASHDDRSILELISSHSSVDIPSNPFWRSVDDIEKQKLI